MAPAAAPLIDGLDYRFDISHSNNVGFIDDTYSKLSNVSGQLNYRVTDNFKIWGAAEYKQDKDRFYWGTPLVPANAPGIVPTNGIVSGAWTNYYLNGHTGPSESGHDRRPDAQHELQRARQPQRREGAVAAQRFSVGHHQQHFAQEPGLRLRGAPHWFNNEINSFDDSGPNNVYRERLALDHAQRLYGNVTDLTINSNIGGMENRLVATVAASSLQFNVSQERFLLRYRRLVNPDRGLYGHAATRRSIPTSTRRRCRSRTG